VSKPRFVCAFRGRRDSYQVPLALDEAGMLDEFITDAYATPAIRWLASRFPGGLLSKFSSRLESGIADERVSCLWGTTVLEHARHRLGFSPTETWLKLDGRFSKAAGAKAARHQTDLFLYSPYAWEAFTRSYRHQPKRVLFQYHPHSGTERRILEEDAAHYPGYGESFAQDDARSFPEALVRRERDVWKHADLIFCASSFTRDSLLAAGCDAGRCRVVPYGIDVAPLEEPQQAAPQTFQALFVGSGGQRKGLHHLLMAWRNANLPPGSKLTLVCRVLDQGIKGLLEGLPTVTLRQGLCAQELQELYSQSTLFVMPSLVEGFGQVYLEALSQGCPVLGTPNTCLPDIGTESEGVFITPAANVEALTSRLETLGRALPGDAQIRQAARVLAAAFPWQGFRKMIREHLTN
jgi:glycosyltransferase involved in cell wall biosynthesis